ncbi:hypothetical protein R6Q59_024184 [Mikania micrantha]
MNSTIRIDSVAGTTIREVEKRQLFLRSYTFHRKERGGRQMKSRIRMKLRSAKIIWFRLHHGFFNVFGRKSKAGYVHNFFDN